MKPTFCLHFTILFIALYMICRTNASDPKSPSVSSSSSSLSSSSSSSASLERQKLPSLETIKNFFSSIDESMIYKITNTIRIANFVAKLRKLFQIKQLKEDLQKRIEQTSGRKTGDKSFRLLGLASNLPTILRTAKTNTNKNEDKIDETVALIQQQMMNNPIKYNSIDDTNKHIENLHNVKL